MALCSVFLAGCLRGPVNDRGGDSDGIEDSHEADDGIVEQETDADAGGDAVEGGDGCGQDVPSSMVTPPSDICTDLPVEHCANTGCPACHVCFVDFGCEPPPWEDAPSCWCMGDGKCYALCDTDENCGEGETCIRAGLYVGHDIPMYSVHICWPDDNPDSPEFP